MSKEAIQAIVGTAVIDKRFLHDLLNSKRQQVIARFDLTPEEYRAITAINVETLEQFAHQLDCWVLSHEQRNLALFPPSAFSYDPRAAMS